MSEAMHDNVISEVGMKPLFSALDAESALQRALSVYLGKAKHEDAFALMPVLPIAMHLPVALASDCLLSLLNAWVRRDIHIRDVYTA